MLEPRPSGRSAADPSPDRERVRVVRVGGDAGGPAPAAPRGQPDPAPSPEAAIETPRRASRTGTIDREPGPAAGPAREATPAAPDRLDTRPAADRSRSTPGPGAIVVAAPHSHPGPDREPTRPEIVIGRVSVIVEAPRPAAPPPQLVVRTAAPASRTADEGPGLAHRFGLGQL